MKILLFEKTQCNPRPGRMRSDGKVMRRKQEKHARFIENMKLNMFFFDISKHQYFYSQIIFFSIQSWLGSSLTSLRWWGDISRTFILCHFTIDFSLTFLFFCLLCDKKNIYGRNMENSYFSFFFGDFRKNVNEIHREFYWICLTPPIWEITFSDELYADMFV